MFKVHIVLPISLQFYYIGRRLSMATDQVGPSDPEVSHEVGHAPAKKITPRKKQVASKIKKKMI